VTTDRPSGRTESVGDPRRRHSRFRDPGVESNARLTAITGLILLVMLAAEGLTLLAIHQLFSWHVAIGLALIPPVMVKLGSTIWRFGRYYLGDPRYRQAGPPHPILRLAGPFVVLTTVAVLATGVAAWAAGPGHHTLVTLHKVSFVLWFAVMTIHVLGHVIRAVRFSAADLQRGRSAAPYRWARWGLIAFSLVAGVIMAVASRSLATGWAGWAHHG
jgi:hypothetical protein